MQDQNNLTQEDIEKARTELIAGQATTIYLQGRQLLEMQQTVAFWIKKYEELDALIKRQSNGHSEKVPEGVLQGPLEGLGTSEN